MNKLTAPAVKEEIKDYLMNLADEAPTGVVEYTDVEVRLLLTIIGELDYLLGDESLPYADKTHYDAMRQDYSPNMASLSTWHGFQPANPMMEKLIPSGEIRSLVRCFVAILNSITKDEF